MPGTVQPVSVRVGIHTGVEVEQQSGLPVILVLELKCEGPSKSC